MCDVESLHCFLHLVIEGFWNVQDVCAGLIRDRKLRQRRDEEWMVCGRFWMWNKHVSPFYSLRTKSRQTKAGK